MSLTNRFGGLLHGADYNPDQWLNYPGVIDQDFTYMDETRCNAFSVGIFSWSQLEPQEGQFNFAWLDDIFDRAARQNIKLFLATPSAAIPAWLAQKDPNVRFMNEKGQREPWGYRQGNCFHSKTFQEHVKIIDQVLAQRYASHPALGGWHISNEYTNVCACPVCRQKFIQFLKDKYGTLDNLNQAYWTAFWGHGLSSWDQVNPFDATLDGILLDWRRFQTQSVVDFFRMEVQAVRQFSDAPVTTNMMGTFPGLDYWKFATYCDFIADDCYPVWYEGQVEDNAASFAMMHDMHYSMQNKPFIMLESCPGIPQYKPYVQIRRPGEFQREMLLALGHGADGTMYFQWRRGLGNCERNHGAVVGHDGTNQTMVFKQVKDYGQHLRQVSEICGAQKHPETAVIFDWESMWALDTTKGYSEKNGKKYEETVLQHYKALWKKNLDLAVIDSDQDFTPYKLLVVPMLYMLKKNVAQRLTDYVKQGGTLVMTYLSAYSDDTNRCIFGGFPGQGLRNLFGIWNEEIDGLAPTTKQSLNWNGKTYPAQDFAEVIHAEGAEILGTYGEQFYQGSPALTKKSSGKGNAYYIALRTDADFLDDFYGSLIQDLNIKPVLEDVPAGVVASRRGPYRFLLNLTNQEQSFTLPQPMTDIWNGKEDITTLTLPPAGSTILKVGD